MKNYNADILSLEDILEILRDKGYTYDEILDMVDHGIDEVFEDQFELDYEEDDEDRS